MNSAHRHGPSHHSRVLGAWWGLFIGDALALPYDGYINLDRLKADYPKPHDYLTPKTPHPHSDLHRHPAGEHPLDRDCLHHRREKWDEPGTHFHHGLQAGDNSFDAELALHLVRHAIDSETQPSWSDHLKTTLLDPRGFKDFHIPKEYRDILISSKQKHEGHANAADEIGPIASAAGTLIIHAANPDRRHRELADIFSTTGHSAALVTAANLYGDILHWVFSGFSPDDACYKKLGHHHHPYMIYPYHRWIANKSDEDVAIHELGQGASADSALPLSLFLALKYSEDFEKAVEANAALGGAACRRGALIGMLLGAHLGCEGIPERLATGLTERNTIDATGELIWNAVNKSPPHAIAC